MLRLTRHPGLWLLTGAVLCVGLSATVYAGRDTEKPVANQAPAQPAKPAAPATTKAAAPASAKPAAPVAAAPGHEAPGAAAKPVPATDKGKTTHGAPEGASGGAPATPAKPAPAKPATAASREAAEKAAIEVVRRIQSVMVQEQTKPATQAASGHAPDAARTRPKAPRPKPVPLLRWEGLPRAGDVTLTWDADLQPGMAAGLGVRLVWPAEQPGIPQK